MKRIVTPLFIVLFAIVAHADIKVCWNDTVRLALNGYKRGIITWQESVDKISWSAAHGQGTDTLVLSPTQRSLHYRAVIKDGTCDTIYSNAITIVLSSDSCLVPPVCTYHSTCSGNVTDSRDNKTYKTIQIGSQCWMAENLNVGTQIPMAQKQMTGIDNQNLSVEKYCYADAAGNCTTYGGLYTWDEMMAYGTGKTSAPGPRGICPQGWHVPADSEWMCLQAIAGDTTTAGGNMKATTLWAPPNTGATNSTGFTALPGGYSITTGNSYGIGTTGQWWSSVGGGGNGYDWKLMNNSAKISYGAVAARNGFSVRCVKD